LFGSCFDPEDGGDMFLRNGGLLSADYTALYARRYNSRQNHSCFEITDRAEPICRGKQKETICQRNEDGVESTFEKSYCDA
jgi:hypothetical protein